jgi:hypothetical protein
VSWNHEGQVLSRPYAAPDLMVLAMLGLLFHQYHGVSVGGTCGCSHERSGIILSMVFNLVVCAASAALSAPVARLESGGAVRPAAPALALDGGWF